jgi:hypothetical protein
MTSLHVDRRGTAESAGSQKVIRDRSTEKVIERLTASTTEQNSEMPIEAALPESSGYT